jgi:hypothetical protein
MAARTYKIVCLKNGLAAKPKSGAIFWKAMPNVPVFDETRLSCLFDLARILTAMFPWTLGQSVLERPIAALSNFNSSAPISPNSATLLIGGMHGDEPATVYLLESFWREYLHLLPHPVVALPLANPDGFSANTRYNARGVDLNRNFGFNWQSTSEEPPGPEPWSEPETRALRELIMRLKPARVVSLHWALAELDADGPQSTELANTMWAALNEQERRPYRLRVYEPGETSQNFRSASGDKPIGSFPDICPGSLGQWCGFGLARELGFAPAMITLELPFDPAIPARPDPFPEDHLDRLRDRWKCDPRGYLEAVQEGVHRMLLAACGEE